MDGWEGAAQAGQDNSSFPLFRQELFNEAIDDLGINRVRMEFKTFIEGTRTNSNVSITNPNGFPFGNSDKAIQRVVIPLRRLLKSKNQQLFINVCYAEFHEDLFHFRYHPDQYAQFVLSGYQYLKTKFNIVPNSWEVILEPDNVNWTPQQI